MLVSLRIRNLALIEDLTWELGPGFNTLTGETGAGKSILIDALNLLLGERADKSLIRTGADACSVEAEVTLGDDARLAEVNAALEEIGAEKCEGRTLLLKRSLTAAGANRQFLNGSPVSLQGLKSIGDLLVDVHGPHDHQSLLATEKQAELLDAYGKLEPLRAACAAHSPRYARSSRNAPRSNSAKANASSASRSCSTRCRKSPRPGSSPATTSESRMIIARHRTRSRSSSRPESSRVILSEAENAVLTQLAQVDRALMAWQRMDASIADAEQLNRQAIAQLQELLSAVQSRAERVDLDPAQLRQLEDRLNLDPKPETQIRRHGGKRRRLRRKAAAQLATLEGRAEFLATLAQREKTARAVLEKATSELSKARRKIAGTAG